MNYYQKYIYYKTKYLSLKQTGGNNNILSRIYNQLQKIKSFDITLISKNPYHISQIPDDIINSKFMDDKIQKELYKYKLYEKLYQLNLNGKQIELLLISPNDDKYITELVYKQLKLFDIYKIIGINKITIIYFPTKFKKKIPSDDIFKPVNINSGYSVLHRFSLIFREEENRKVIVHELIHQLGIDKTFDLIYNFNESFPFNIKKNNNVVLFNETFVEVSTNLIMIGIKSIEENKNPLKIFTKEKEFAFTQTAKILKLSGFNDYNEFINNTTSNKLKYIDTNIFAYYIARAIIFCYFDEYIKLLTNYDTNPVFFNPNILYNKKLYSLIINFILNKGVDQKFISTINNYFKTINKNNKIMYQTLRMTFDL